MKRVLLRLRTLFNNRKFRIGFDSSLVIAGGVVVGLSIYYLAAPVVYTNLEEVVINSHQVISKIDAITKRAGSLGVSESRMWLQLEARLVTLKELLNFVLIEFAKLVQSEVKEGELGSREGGSFAIKNSTYLTTAALALLSEAQSLEARLSEGELGEKEREFVGKLRASLRGFEVDIKGIHQRLEVLSKGLE